jgi:hypothetical protein
MLIINSFLAIPHNLIHKYKHALVNKGFKNFISNKNTHAHAHIYKEKKEKNTQTEKF